VSPSPPGPSGRGRRRERKPLGTWARREQSPVNGSGPPGRRRDETNPVAPWAPWAGRRTRGPRGEGFPERTELRFGLLWFGKRQQPGGRGRHLTNPVGSTRGPVSSNEPSGHRSRRRDETKRSHVPGLVVVASFNDQQQSGDMSHEVDDNLGKPRGLPGAGRRSRPRRRAVGRGFPASEVNAPAVRNDDEVGESGRSRTPGRLRSASRTVTRGRAATRGLGQVPRVAPE
jgi:hypothetical protein